MYLNFSVSRRNQIKSRTKKEVTKPEEKKEAEDVKVKVKDGADLKIERKENITLIETEQRKK